jgi:hypothetical protein
VVERARRRTVFQGARRIAANIVWRGPQTGEECRLLGAVNLLVGFFGAALSVTVRGE